MKKYAIILILSLILSSCELIVISSKKQETIPIDRNSALGAVLLFKTELDSSNVPAATQILAKEDGKIYLAFEKYELYDEIARIGRILNSKSVTNYQSDTLTPEKLRIDVEFDYINSMTFTTARIDSLWFIVDYKEHPVRTYLPPEFMYRKQE